MQTVTNSPADAKPAARSLHEICESTGELNCGHCWALPGNECVFTSASGSVSVIPGIPMQPVRGYDVARFNRAMRRGLISGPELIPVLETADGFSTSTVIYDQAQGVHLRLVPGGGQ